MSGSKSVVFCGQSTYKLSMCFDVAGFQPLQKISHITCVPTSLWISSYNSGEQGRAENSVHVFYKLLIILDLRRYFPILRDLGECVTLAKDWAKRIWYEQLG
jgi:hypothetical protein